MTHLGVDLAEDGEALGEDGHAMDLLAHHLLALLVELDPPLDVRDHQRRAGHDLKLAPLRSDLLDGPLAGGAPFGHETSDHRRRDQEQQDQEADQKQP